MNTAPIEQHVLVACTAPDRAGHDRNTRLMICCWWTVGYPKDKTHTLQILINKASKQDNNLKSFYSLCRCWFWHTLITEIRRDGSTIFYFYILYYIVFNCIFVYSVLWYFCSIYVVYVYIPDDGFYTPKHEVFYIKYNCADRWFTQGWG
jgi:hypothetical protein